MSTGHINPGYNCPVTNLERINKLPNPIENKIIYGLTPEISNKRWLLLQPSLSNDILENIRRKARESWSTVDFHDNNSSTTYLGNFQIKHMDEPTKPRPTSPTRMNNPHPSAIFLTCRLHHLPGFHRDDTLPINNEINQIISRKSPFSETDSKDIAIRSQSVKNETAKYSVNENRTSNSDKASINSGHSRAQLIHEFVRPKSTISLFSNRSRDQSTISTSTKVGRPHTSCPKYHNNRSSNARSRCKSSIYQKTEYPRGDYSIHYQWPVTLPHHHLF